MADNSLSNGRLLIYPAADQAIIEISSFSKFLSPQEVSDEQVLELKLCALFLPHDSRIIVSQTYLQESPSFRLTMETLAEFAEHGFLRLFTGNVDSYEVIEQKRDAYENVRTVAKYHNAYYRKNAPKPDYSVYYTEQKLFNSGSLAHRIWIRRGQKIASSQGVRKQFSELINRVAAGDTGNSTWESTARHLIKSGIPTAIRPVLHALSFTSYLDSHRNNGIGVVTGSRIATSIFTGSDPLLDFDLEAARVFLKKYDIATAVRQCSPKAILAARQELVSNNFRNAIRKGSFNECLPYASELSRGLLLLQRSQPPKNLAQESLQMASIYKRTFDVALSFPGKHRKYVEETYRELMQFIPKESIFYDFAFQAELATPDLDTLLQTIYHRQSRLLVVFIAQAYAESEWCGLEWRAVRDLIKRKESKKIMLIKLEDVDIDGLFSIDGYIDASKLTANELASLIAHRLTVV